MNLQLLWWTMFRTFAMSVLHPLWKDVQTNSSIQFGITDLDDLDEDLFWFPHRFMPVARLNRKRIQFGIIELLI